jgi:hypothetical protein
MLPMGGAGIDLDDLRGLPEQALPGRLAAVAERLRAAAFELSDGIGQRYFAHAADESLHRV